MMTKAVNKVSKPKSASDGLPKNIQTAISKAVAKEFARIDLTARIEEAVEKLDIASIVEEAVIESQAG